MRHIFKKFMRLGDYRANKFGFEMSLDYGRTSLGQMAHKTCCIHMTFGSVRVKIVQHLP